jgi:prohibitin 1
MQIKQGIIMRLREYHILLDDVSITALTFGKLFTDAIEQKQIAQQAAERAKFIVQ